MGENLNISIVLFNCEYTQIANLVYLLKTNICINQIYLVDNSASRNKAFEISGTTYIYNGMNLGYGAAHNIAIKKSIEAGIKYHLVLNPDIYFDAEALNKLLNYIDQNEDIGLVMPMVKYPNGNPQYLCKLLGSPFDLFGRRFVPLERWVEVKNNRYELRFTGYDKIMQVPSLSGCFMLLRTAVLEKVGEFDERFFMYCEDLDLCRRIGKVSRTMFYPEVSIFHDYEKGSYKNSALLMYHMMSAIKYFNKWGWFFDKERRRINRETLNKLGYNRLKNV